MSTNMGLLSIAILHLQCMQDERRVRAQDECIQ
jgi:hypothetical protein